MWRGYESALAEYLWAGVRELYRRGRDYMDRPWAREIDRLRVARPDLPPWLGREDFHAAHRSNLLRKDPDWYGRFGWPEPDDLPYVWPV